jgi:hypothetical protein
MSIITKIEQITPELATTYLAKNSINRPLRRLGVLNFIKRIEEGSFHTTHQGIAFDMNGVLLDGQHRLTAIAESNKTVEMMVSRGLDSSTFESLDCGIIRKLSDRVIIDAENPWRNSRLTAIATGIYNMSGSRYGKSGKPNVSPLVVKQTYDIYSVSIHVILDDIFYKVPKDVKPTFVGSRFVLAACCLLHSYDAVEGFDFATRLFTGAPIRTYSDEIVVMDPVSIARNYLSKKKGLSVKEIIERVFWAMNRNHINKPSKNCGRDELPWFLSEAAKI